MIGVERKLMITRIRYVPKINVKTRVEKSTGVELKITQAMTLKTALSSNPDKSVDVLTRSHNQRL